MLMSSEQAGLAATRPMRMGVSGGDGKDRSVELERDVQSLRQRVQMLEQALALEQTTAQLTGLLRSADAARAAAEQKAKHAEAKARTAELKATALEETARAAIARLATSEARANAAEERVRHLTEKLQCSICLDRIADRILQPCGHVVCGQCDREPFFSELPLPGTDLVEIPLCKTCRAPISRGTTRFFRV